MMEDRFDYVFSYWLFAWWILYALKATRSSPALWLWAAVLFEIVLFIILVNRQYPVWYITLFVLINLVIKGWPLWSMRRETPRGIWPGVLLFLTYTAWLHVNGESVSTVTGRASSQIKQNKPFSVGINQLISRIFKSGPIHNWITS